MNKRIQELAVEAGRTGLPYGEIEIQKFAELIIQECLKIVDPGDMVCGDEWFTTLEETAQEIKEHFGLE